MTWPCKWQGWDVELPASRGVRVTESTLCRYKKILGKARKFELDQHSVILCTCSCAASASLQNLNVWQILIDEAGMATEPETLIPLVCFSQAKKVRDS
jgi:superfamily I DNA and/or RNA helicase